MGNQSVDSQRIRDYVSVMKKAVLYARVSTKDQEREGYSIPAQIELLRNYAHQRKIKIVKEFIESDSAGKAGRKRFLEMISLLESNKSIDGILVEKTDRLYRNFKDQVTIDELNIETRLTRGSSLKTAYIPNIKIVRAPGLLCVQTEIIDFDRILVGKDQTRLYLEGAQQEYNAFTPIRIIIPPNYCYKVYKEVISGYNTSCFDVSHDLSNQIGFKNHLVSGRGFLLNFNDCLHLKMNTLYSDPIILPRDQNSIDIRKPLNLEKLWITNINSEDTQIQLIVV